MRKTLFMAFLSGIATLFMSLSLVAAPKHHKKKKAKPVPVVNKLALPKLEKDPGIIPLPKPNKKPAANVPLGVSK